MVITWEEKDILCGIRVCVEHTAEESIIGFTPWEDGDARYVLTSLDDGMQINRPCNKKALAEHLTDGCYIPVALKKLYS